MANTILGRLLIQIAGNTVELNKSLQSAQSQLTGFQKSVSATQKLVNSIGVGAGFTAMLGVLRGGINTIKDFEHQMSVVKSVTNATDKEFQQLKDSALELGRTTKFTSQEVAELQTEFAKLGFTTQEILDATEATINLSIATGEDLAKSADVAGSTLRAFNLDASEMGRLVDVMTASFNKSALGIENFSEAMKYVAPIAAQAGLSLEQTTAMLGVLADNGIRGSSAGTALRKIISDLGTESGDTSERIAKLAAKGLSGAQAMDEVGRTAYAALLVLSKNTDKVNALDKALQDVAGSAKETAKIMSDDLAGDLDELDSAYEGLVLTMSDSSSVFREVVQAGTQLIQMLSDQDGVVGGLVQKWLYLVTTVPRTIGNLIGYVAKLTGAEDDAAKKAQELADKNLAIANTVKAAFDSGNIEAYIKALDTNIYKEEIIAKIRAKQAEDAKKLASAPPPVVVVPKGLIESLQEKIKKFEEAKEKAFSPDAVGKFNDKIKELKDELDLLNTLTNDTSGFLKNVLNAEAGTVDVKSFDFAKERPNDLKVNSFQKGENEDFFGQAAFEKSIKKYQEGFAIIQQGYKDTGVIAFNSSEQQVLAWALQQEAMERMRQSIESLGSEISSSIQQSISANETFGQSLARLAKQVVAANLARALSSAIAKSFETAKNPIVGGILAGLSSAAVFALFNKIPSQFKSGSGGGGGGGSISGATNVSRTSVASQSETFEKVVFEIEGNKLVGVLKNQQSRSEITG